MLCEKHQVRLQPVRVGGRIVYRCPHSHTKRYEESGGAVCRRCKKSGVRAEGLCYTCWYYGQ
jgi:hypothetical protein